jgi:hypothetical protein
MMRENEKEEKELNRECCCIGGARVTNLRHQFIFHSAQFRTLGASSQMSHNGGGGKGALRRYAPFYQSLRRADAAEAVRSERFHVSGLRRRRRQ